MQLRDWITFSNIVHQQQPGNQVLMYMNIFKGNATVSSIEIISHILQQMT